MKLIKVTSGDSQLNNLLLRQSPGSKGAWGDCQFVLNQRVDKCDWWFVLHSSSLRQPDHTVCDPEKIVYISMEPTEAVLATRKGFLNQFSKVVLTDRSVEHPGKIYACGNTWWVGFTMRYGPNGHKFDPNVRLDYDGLKAIGSLEKKNRISVIVSAKKFLPGHISRLEFLKAIQSHPVSQYIDLYGGGFRPIDDKWDAIAPYMYHLTLENMVLEDYWTEKLADPLLGFSLPFYSGCPNIQSYFPQNSVLPIDIAKPSEAADYMLRMVKENAFQKHIKEVISARSLVLDRYNIFNLMSTIAAESDHDVEYAKPITLNPNEFFSA